MATLTQKIADWVTKHGFERIALQFPDALLADAPEILQKVCFVLKERRVFILGDSSSGGGGVDEVGALHYGADCIVRFGNAEQQRGGDLPVLFVFGDDDSSDAFCVGDADEVVRRVDGLFAKQGHSEADEMNAHLLVLCDLPNQHLAERLGTALLEGFGKSSASGQPQWRVLMAIPRLEVFSGDVPVWHDFRWGCLDIADGWWSALGTLTLAGAARPPVLKVCGREVHALGPNEETASVAGRALPPNSAILYVGPRGSTLERCVLLRYGATCPVWRLERSCVEETDRRRQAPLERIFSHALLQKRYRFVELAKAAGTVGLLLVAAGGPTALGRALARRLELLLARAGRQSYRLVVGQPTQEKLGNFPDIECYVLLSGPEQFTWEVRDLMVPVCTPFELEVALGARKWTGEYITDLEELLRTAPMTELLSQTSEEGPTVVQTLGATKIRSFEKSSQQTAVGSQSSQKDRVKPPPASITPGLHGVPWKYSQEESFQNGSGKS